MSGKQLSTAEKFLKGFLEKERDKVFFFEKDGKKAMKADHDVDWLVNNRQFNEKIADQGTRDFAVAMAHAGLFEPAHLEGVLKAADKFESEFQLFMSIMRLRDIISAERERTERARSEERLKKGLKKWGIEYEG